MPTGNAQPNRTLEEGRGEAKDRKERKRRIREGERWEGRRVEGEGAKESELARGKSKQGKGGAR
eukprot:364202-Chlamydomonas_euryale.AAC.9